MDRIGIIWNMCHSKTQGLALSHTHIWKSCALSKELLDLQSAGLKIVFTNGCYDILHPGHVDLLARAKKLGDILVLALNSDNSVKSLNKGPNRPINTLAVRAFNAAHLSSVDFVTSFDESTPYNLIKQLKPHVLVKGGDWAVEDIVGADIVQDHGGLVFSLPLLEGFSTTKLIETIRNS